MINYTDVYLRSKLKLKFRIYKIKLWFLATFNEVENIKNFLNIVLKINDIDVLIIDDNSLTEQAKL